MNREPADGSAGRLGPVPAALLGVGLLLAYWLYLFVVVQGSMLAAEDPVGVALPGWLLGPAAVVAPWVFGNAVGGVASLRRRRTLLGLLGSVVAVGVMVYSPAAGAILGLAWVVGVQFWPTRQA
ncbi:hypothetical protein [Granulicoccus phenolivorans]|uniref:hypothetical protein n=1 Tax=Granulicoccus phenolivorans TaxID=266854 RepID=UPI000404E602|nr:hypothetical protein [Granulicoccus phenolivorans]